MTTDEIVEFILEDATEADILSIQGACADRKKRNARKTFHVLNVGDRVRFSQSSRPTYLRGVEGTIIAKRQTKLVVDLDESCGRFHTKIISPPSLLEKIPAKKGTKR